MHRSTYRRWAFMILLILAGVSQHCASSPTAPRPASVKTPRHSLPGYIRGSRDSNAEQVIIFVHGIFGNGDDTWTNETTGAYFPQLLVDDRTFSKADIWVHDYPTPRFSRSYSIDELADHLRRHLHDDDVIAHHKQVIFIAHSMGGLVVRAYLLKYREDVSSQQIPMLYFFSTPTTGADIANLGKFLSKNPQLSDMRKLKTNDSGVLGTWDAQWNSSPYARRVGTFCAYETLPTLGIQVVQRESAEHLCNRHPDPIRADHINIVKPASARDESFIAFRDAYREVFGGGVSAFRPALNLRSQPHGFISASSNSSNPLCDNCWASEELIEPGQKVYVRLHYENDGAAAAHHVRLRLAAPNGLLSDSMVVATLSSDDSDPIHGAVCVGTPGRPVAFIPLTASWFPNNSKEPLPLPNDQSAAALTSLDGLEIGDVNAGLEFSSELVATFRTLPITVTWFRDVERLINRVEPILQERGGDFEMAEMARLITPDLHVDAAEIDVDQSFEARGSITRLNNLIRGEVVLAYVFVHNENSVPLHACQMSFAAASDHGDRLDMRVMSKETSFDVARIPVSFSKGATTLDFIGSFRLPPGLCETAHSVADVMKLVSVKEDSCDIGDLGSNDTAIMVCYFEVR